MRSVVASLAVWCLCLGLSGCSSCRRDPDKARGSGAAATAPSAQPAVLAELPADGTQSDATPADGAEFVFAARGGGVAYLAGAEGRYRVVHNGRAGAPYAAIGTVVLSPDGRRCAYPALTDGKWRMVLDGKQGPSFGELGTPAFSPDGLHLAYQASTGDSWHLVVDGTVDRGSPTQLLTHEFVGSSRVVLVSEIDDQGCGKLVVTDLALEKRTIVDARVCSVVLDADRSRVAAVGASGDGRQVLTFAADRPDLATRGPEQEAIDKLTFGPDGVSLAYVAERSGKRLVVLGEKVEPLPPGELVGSGHGGSLVVRPDGSGAGALMASEGSVVLQQFFLPGAPPEAAHEEAESLVYGGDGRLHAYAARRGERWFVVANGKEGPAFDRVVSPSFSPDGKYLVYRARQEGKRFVVIADPSGKTIRQLPAFEQVFPVRFTADGKSIAYGVKDGRRLEWKVEPL